MSFLEQLINGPSLPRLVVSKLASCEPVAITMGVMAVAGAAASIAGQEQQKQAAEGHEREKSRAVDFQISETRKRATDDYINQVRLEQTQQRQEQEAIVEKSSDLARQATAAAATGMASAAERNVAGGRTLDSILADYRVQEDFETGRLKENQRLRDRQHAERIRAYGNQFKYNASSVHPYQQRPVQPVDYFGPIFGAIGQTANTAVRTGAVQNMLSGSGSGSDPWTTFGVVQSKEAYGPFKPETSWDDTDVGY
jgi:hypothetical protein